jgi:hypothetical protein
MSILMSNELGLSPVTKEVQPEPGAAVSDDRPESHPLPERIQMEFAFELPKGFLDSEGNLHRRGVMRLAKAVDEIVPMRDPRVQSNPAYATVLILARVITRLGALTEVSPFVIEGLFACDLNYLQTFYRQINELENGTD